MLEIRSCDSILTVALKQVHAYQIRVALRGIRPPIWRRLAVPAEFTLEELHRAIQVAFGWTNSHLFEFRVDGESFGLTDEEIDAQELSRSSLLLSTKVSNVFQRSCKAIYVYDMGDHWVHEIKVEREIPHDEAKAFAACTGGERLGPPEDCGGPAGFRDFLDSLSGATPGKGRAHHVVQSLDIEQLSAALRSLDEAMPPLDVR